MTPFPASSPELFAPPLVGLVPFALLLLLIAVMPLTPHALKHAWEKSYPAVAILLGALVVGYYVISVPHGGHRTLETLTEYFEFIALIGSLFVVAGNLHVTIRGEARPAVNVIFLLIGALLANVIGTTGASMVLIRPWIRMNKYRITSLHVVFFIFVVSNVGGALTPIGDPPLFLGFLHGVPFFWLLDHAMLPWLFTLGSLLAVFFVLDLRNFRRAPRAVRERETRDEPVVKVEGLHNLIFLLVIVAGVFLTDRFFLRPLVMLTAAAASYRSTARPVREANDFNFGPIKEVAFLFFGIFTTMMPALDYLKAHGREYGLERPVEYYVASGSLSAVLDNAPTYLNFFTLAQASLPPAEVQTMPGGQAAAEAKVVAWMLDADNFVGPHRALDFVVAISLGAVFFGAMTYIGNGPNFMVKSIADSAKVHTPGFFGYVFKFSLPILLPILLVCGWMFL